MREFNFLEAGYKVGDRVWDSWQEKWKVITKIQTAGHLAYPIVIEDSETMNATGLYRTDANRRYFPNSFDVPDSAYERPRPDLEVDAKVWVRNAPDYGQWVTRHFSRWDDKCMFCWDNGQTSHTQTKGDSRWWYYRLTPPEENE